MLVSIVIFCPFPTVIMQMKMDNMLLQSLDKSPEFFRIPSTGKVCVSYVKGGLKVFGIHSLYGPEKFFCFAAKVRRVCTFFILKAQSNSVVFG